MKKYLCRLRDYIIKVSIISVITLFYLMEFLFYYMFASPVDPGYMENPYGDFTFLTALAVIKLLIVVISVLNLKRLQGRSHLITIFATAASFIEIIALAPALSHSASSLSTIRNIIPICTNTLIFLFGLIYYNKVQKTDNIYDQRSMKLYF